MGLNKRTAGTPKIPGDVDTSSCQYARRWELGRVRQPEVRPCHHMHGLNQAKTRRLWGETHLAGLIMFLRTSSHPTLSPKRCLGEKTVFSNSACLGKAFRSRQYLHSTPALPQPSWLSVVRHNACANPTLKFKKNRRGMKPPSYSVLKRRP